LTHCPLSRRASVERGIAQRAQSGCRAVTLDHLPTPWLRPRPTGIHPPITPRVLDQAEPHPGFGTLVSGRLSGLVLRSSYADTYADSATGRRGDWWADLGCGAPSCEDVPLRQGVRAPGLLDPVVGVQLRVVVRCSRRTRCPPVRTCTPGRDSRGNSLLPPQGCLIADRPTERPVQGA
jgi:hypothetical protein